MFFLLASGSPAHPSIDRSLSRGSSPFLLGVEGGLAAVLNSTADRCMFVFNEDALNDVELEFPSLAHSSASDELGWDPESEAFDDDSSGGAGSSSSTSLDSSASAISDDMDLALRSSSLGSLLADTCVLCKVLTSASRACAVAAFDHVFGTLSACLEKLQASLSAAPPPPEGLVERQVWDACVCFRLLETGVASAVLVHASQTHFGKFGELATNLMGFCQR